MITQYRPSLKASSTSPTEIELVRTHWGSIRADRAASIRGVEHLRRTLTRMPIDDLIRRTAYCHIYRIHADRFERKVASPADFRQSFSLAKLTRFDATLPFFYTAQHAAGSVVETAYISLAIPIYTGLEKIPTAFAVATTYDSPARVCTVLHPRTARSNHRRYLNTIEDSSLKICCN